MRVCACVALITVHVSCNSEEPVVRSDFRPEPRDLALVLDTSGSMVKNDPNRTAIYATKILADLVEPQDRLYVVTFPGREIPGDKRGRQRRRSKPISFKKWAASEQATIGPLPAKALKERIERLKYSSNFTVFQEPLEVAVRNVTKPSAKGSRSIVFFSDGATDRFNDGQPHEDYHAKEVAALSMVGPVLRDAGVRFFGLTLGEASHDQFDTLAQETGGEVLHVKEPQDLADRFATVFSRILETRVEPIQFSMDEIQSFEVRNYVKELIFLIPQGTADIQLRFQEPRETKWKLWENGRSLDTTNALAVIPERCLECGVCRIDDASTGAGDQLNQYTILRVPRPRPGTWKATLSRSPTSDIRALLIQNYDLYLEVMGEEKREGWVGEPNRYEARLVTSEGEVVRDPEIFAGCKYRFTVRDGDGQVIEDRELRPDEKSRMICDFLPQTEDRLNVQITLSNDSWLTRRVHTTFKGVKDIHLHQQSPAAFGHLVPWADPFIETLGRSLNAAVRVWKPGDRRNCTWVDFAGSAPQARGVPFLLDNSELMDKYGVRIVNEDGESLFTVQGKGEECRARICIEARRTSKGGNIGQITLPIRSSSGREISGTTELLIDGNVEKLTLVWRALPIWLPLELYIALKLLKGLAFWLFCGFSRGDRIREDMQKKGSKRKGITTYFYPGPFGIYRIPLLPRLLSLPFYMVLSFFNFLRVAWVMRTWEYPPTKPTIRRCLYQDAEGRKRKEPIFSEKERNRYALLAILMDGLLFSIWLGPIWRPSTSVGQKIIVTKLMNNLYFTETAGGKEAGAKWRQKGREIKFRHGSSFQYKLG
jgi:hypothetical protein